MSLTIGTYIWYRKWNGKLGDQINMIKKNEKIEGEKWRKRLSLFYLVLEEKIRGMW